MAQQQHAKNVFLGSTHTLSQNAEIVLLENIRISLRTVAKPVPQVEQLDSEGALMCNPMHAKLYVEQTSAT